MMEQKAIVTYLENMVKTEMLVNRQANVALQNANTKQAKLKGEVQDLLAQL